MILLIDFTHKTSLSKIHLEFASAVHHPRVWVNPIQISENDRYPLFVQFSLIRSLVKILEEERKKMKEEEKEKMGNGYFKIYKLEGNGVQQKGGGEKKGKVKQESERDFLYKVIHSCIFQHKLIKS